MKSGYILILLFLFNVGRATGQDPDIAENKDHHDHHRNEIGIASSIVYFTTEKELSYGLHLHYSHYIKETKFGIGVEYERIFDDHRHNTIGLVCSYRPAGSLSLNLSPGLTYEGSGSAGIKPAIHFETLYEFEISDLHIGPVAGFAYDGKDFHINAGLHIGLGF